MANLCNVCRRFLGFLPRIQKRLWTQPVRELHWKPQKSFVTPRIFSKGVRGPWRLASVAAGLSAGSALTLGAAGLITVYCFQRPSHGNQQHQIML